MPQTLQERWYYPRPGAEWVELRRERERAIRQRLEQLNACLNYLTRERDIDDVLSKIYYLEDELRTLWR